MSPKQLSLAMLCLWGVI